jgi:adenine-specific DNA-methyltransferase
MAEVRTSILEHFDADVQERLRIHKERALSVLDDLQRTLLNLARYELGDDASFNADEPAFSCHGAPYHFDWRSAEARNAQHFSPEHPLAQQCMERALTRDLTARKRLTCNLTGHHAPVAALEPHLGKTGWLGCAHLAIKGANEEQFVILSGVADDGTRLDADQCRRLLELAILDEEPSTESGPDQDGLFADLIAEKVDEVEARNSAFLDEEAAKLDRWADDLRTGLELELKQLDRDIKEAKKDARSAPSLAIKVAAQRRIKDMERRRNLKRQALFEEQDRIEQKREDMILAMEDLLRQGHQVSVDFVCEWRLV